MVFLIFFSSTHPPPLLVAVPHNQQQWPQTPFFSINPPPISPRRIYTKSRRWDSNAETFRRHSFDFDSIDEDTDFEDDEWLDILEDFIDGVWIFKAFRSFGWMLPAVISSLLLTSGPKAFLMALALPLAQSALSFAFQLVWGRPKNRAKRRGKSKRKPPPPRSKSRPADKERKRADGWVAGNDKQSNSSFGGWEELDDFNMHSSNGKGKINLSRRERRSQTPLLLRLLIAVFPFLGSWTRML